MSVFLSLLSKRQHIQDHGNADKVIYYWGYASRVVPCANDAISCAYLDFVYSSHVTSMLYTFIMWGMIGGFFLLLIFLRVAKPKSRRQPQLSQTIESAAGKESSKYRAWKGIQVFARTRLLPEGLVRWFGHVTQLQLLILAIITVYLTIFSFIGITYTEWFTPVKNTPGVYSHRTSLSAWSNRVGILAYALTPLTVALGTRESILTLLTGIPYQSFNFMHRWTGRIIVVQGLLHSIGWFIIELRLYQPQPRVWNNFVKELYAVWGLVAFVLLLLLWILSFSVVIKRTGYEFFKKAHYVLAMVYVGACWGHWQPLACWLIASLGVWLLDRGVRILRTILIHTRKIDGSTGCKFKPAQSTIQYFDDPDGGVVRLEMTNNFETWSPGQHFFLTFPALTLWQSHPLTVMSLADGEAPRHVYIARARKGETGRLKKLALATIPSASSEHNLAQSQQATTPVVLCGPYGPSLLNDRNPELTNILAIAGGTGVSLILPLTLAATAQCCFLTSSPNTPAPAAIDFVWMIRRESNIDWCTAELSILCRRASEAGANLRIHIFVTKEARSQGRSASLCSTSLFYDTGKVVVENEKLDVVEPVSTSSSGSAVASLEKAVKSEVNNYSVTFMDDHHPSLAEVVKKFMEERAVGAFRTRVVASGPRGMGSDLRAAVASANDGRKVWKGDARYDVSLEWDDRG